MDAQGKATCLSGCAVVWPHEYFKDLRQNDLGTGLNIADFGVVTNSDGGLQTTYKGHPLYIYTGDTRKAGVWSVTGNNIEGGAWFAGQPDFTVFISNNKKVTGMDSAYLTTPAGMALYTTTAATPDARLVTFKATSPTIDVPAKLSAAAFSPSGAGVLSYNGSLLYACTADMNSGDIKGAAIGNTSLVILP